MKNIKKTKWRLFIGIALVLAAFVLMYYLPQDPLTTVTWITVGIVGGRLISKEIY